MNPGVLAGWNVRSSSRSSSAETSRPRTIQNASRTIRSGESVDEFAGGTVAELYTF